MELIGSNIPVTREVKIAFNNASRETNKLKREILSEALEEWLVGHGFLDPKDKIAI